MHVASYEWRDPVAAKPPLPLFDGATPLPAQTDLMRRARAVIRGGAPADEGRLVLLETEAPVDEVAAYYATALGTDGVAAKVTRTAGDFGADEASLTPVLERLGVAFTRGAKGSYASAVIEGAPGMPHVSLQRPYRDFVGDRIVDRTLVIVSD